MGAQVFGTGFEQLEEQAAANNVQHLLAPYAAEANPVRQSLYEHQMAGQWRACTGCHVSNQAWEVDARMAEARNLGGDGYMWSYEPNELQDAFRRAVLDGLLEIR